MQKSKMAVWGGLTNSCEKKTYLEDVYKVNFESISPTSPAIGDVVEYTIYRFYSPLIMAKQAVKLTASRTTVIGYYG